MNRTIDPKAFGLHPKTVIKQTAKNHFNIVILRKSRIVMSDGKKILEKAGTIKEHNPGVKVSLKTSAPLCSKTVVFLKENGIDVV